MSSKKYNTILGKGRLASLIQLQGFALPMAILLGLVMIAIGGASLLVAQEGRNTAVQRQATGNASLVTDGGIARALVQLVKPNNMALLIRNYDSLNPKTNQTYLGADGIPYTGDEENTVIDEWSTYDPNVSCGAGAGTPNIPYSGIFGTDSQYILKAYRYNNSKKEGSLLIEGQKGTSTFHVIVTLSVEATTEKFPGILSSGNIALFGHQIQGSNGNVYYDPALSADTSLTASSAPGDTNRPNYLNAIKSGSNDGYTTDTVSGDIIACKLTPTLPSGPVQGTDLGTLKDPITLSGSSSGIVYYQANKIELKDNVVVDANTTDGPIYLYVTGDAKLQDNAKIRNIRTDGAMPRVGDLRIIVTNKSLSFDDASCVDTAFIYVPQDKLTIKNTSDGCPSPGISNIDGVVWAQQILHTNIGSPSPGVSVPEDVSSLSDILNYVGLPTKKKIGGIKNWQKISL